MKIASNVHESQVVSYTAEEIAMTGVCGLFIYRDITIVPRYEKNDKILLKFF